MKVLDIASSIKEVAGKIERAASKIAELPEIEDIMELKLSQIEFLSCCKVIKILDHLEKEVLSLLD